MEKKIPLLLFTNMFPYGNVENLLELELDFLTDHFSEIVIVPNQLGFAHRKLPTSVKVDNSFAEGIEAHSGLKKLKRVIKALTSINTYKEIFNNPSLLGDFNKLKFLFYYVSQSEYYYAWLSRFLKKNPQFLEGIFLYLLAACTVFWNKFIKTAPS